jgi:hypothetical protein
MVRTMILCILVFFISEICAFSQASGLRDQIAVIENKSMGDSTTGFGSCFLWVDSRTRDNYLVSCEHVTHDAHHLLATFQSRNGDLVSICKGK